MYKITQSANALNLSLNENYTSFCKEITLELNNLNLYPNVEIYKQIHKEASVLYGVPQENILLTNGSDDGIFLIEQCFAGKSILITHPTFSMYESYAKNLGREVIKQNLDDDLKIDTDLLLSNIHKYDPSLVFIPNPNSPTGTVLGQNIIESLLKTGKRIVIDEAYIEFSNRESSLSFLEKYPNLIVLRTLSKFYGLAGVRIGFVICKDVDQIKKFQAPFSVSSPNANIALKTLRYINKNQNEIRIFRKDFIQERERFVSELSKSADKVCETEANFVLAKIKNASQIVQNLRDNGFLIKDFSTILSDTLRVTLHTREVNDKILSHVLRGTPIR